MLLAWFSMREMSVFLVSELLDFKDLLFCHHVH